MVDVDGPAGLPQALALDAGSTADVVLPGLGTAGYAWEASVEGTPGVVDVHLRRGDEGDRGDGGAGPAGDPPAARLRVGAAVPETLSVTGIAPGRVVLQLAQRRPWEHGVPPRAHHRIDVVVR